jgi:hypothetical protein
MTCDGTAREGFGFTIPKCGFKMHGNVEVDAGERKQANEAHKMPRLFDHCPIEA